jgi:hypothetical protein
VADRTVTAIDKVLKPAIEMIRSENSGKKIDPPKKDPPKKVEQKKTEPPKKVEQKKTEPPKKEAKKEPKKPKIDHEQRALMQILLPMEKIVYKYNELVFTNKRIIKTNTSALSRAFGFFYKSYEDLDYRFIEGIKSHNAINWKMFILGVFIWVLPFISWLIKDIPVINYANRVIDWLINGLQGYGIFIVGLFCIVFAFILTKTLRLM